MSSSNAKRRKSSTDDATKDLRSLLTAWKLQHLLPRLEAEHFDVEVLTMMKPKHVQTLMHSYPLGDQVRFEYHLQRWRLEIGRPLDHYDNEDITRSKVYKKSPKTETIPFRETILEDLLDTLHDETNTSALSEETSLTTSQKSQQKTGASAARSTLGENRDDDPPDLQSITLRQILKASVSRGTKLLQYFEENQILQDFHRVELINMVAAYFDKYNMTLPLGLCQKLERDLIVLFPTENVKDYYVESGKSKFQVRLRNMKYYRNVRKVYNKRITEQQKLLGTEDSQSSYEHSIS